MITPGRAPLRLSGATAIISGSLRGTNTLGWWGPHYDISAPEGMCRNVDAFVSNLPLHHLSDLPLFVSACYE